MHTRTSAPVRAASSLMALSATFLAMASLPAVAGAAVGDVTKVPLPRTDADSNVGITAGADGNLWVVDPGEETQITPRAAKLWRVTTGGSATGFSLAARTNAGNELGAIAATESGVSYFDLNGGITRMSYDGTRSPSIATTQTTAQESVVQRLSAAPNGDLWWGSFTSPVAGRLSSASALSEFVAPEGTFPGAESLGPGLYQVAFDQSGGAWVSAARESALYRVNANGTFSAPIKIDVPNSGPFPSLSSPTGLALGPDGNIWFNHLTGNVGYVTPSGTSQQVFSKATDSGVGLAIAAGADGKMWYSVSSQGEDGGGNGEPQRPAKIGWVTTSGEKQEYTLPGESEIVQLVAGADGAMWATDSSGSSLLRIDTGASAAVTKTPAMTGSTTAGGTLTCGGETFASWPGGAPTTAVSWTRDGATIAGATARTFTTTTADIGKAIACKVTARYVVQKVWAPATSSAATIVAQGTPPTPTPVPTATPTPTATPQPTAVATPTPAPAGPTPTPAAPAPTPTPAAPAPTATPAPSVVIPGVNVPKPGTPQNTTLTQVQIITCKYKKPKGKAAKKNKAIKATCKTTLAATPAKSTREVKATIGRRGKANAATVIIGSAALRIVSPRILPKGAFTLTAGKKRWTVNVG